MVLFSDHGGEFCLHFADRLDDRRAPGRGCVGNSRSALSKNTVDDKFLPGCAAGALCFVFAFSLFAPAFVGQHVRVARGFQGRPNAGKRWSVVSDGFGAAPFSMDARGTVAVLGAGDGSSNGAGILGGACYVVYVLA